MVLLQNGEFLNFGQYTLRNPSLYASLKFDKCNIKNQKYKIKANKTSALYIAGRFSIINKHPYLKITILFKRFFFNYFQNFFQK